MKNCNKEEKPTKETSKAMQEMLAYLKSIGAKDKTAERMGKASIHFTKK